MTSFGFKVQTHIIKALITTTTFSVMSPLPNPKPSIFLNTITCLSAMSRTRLHLSTTAPTLFQTSTHLAGRLFSANGAAAIAALALVILFVFLLHIYAKRRFLQPPSSSTGDNATSPPVPTGLDDSAVASIPCFVYDPSTWQCRNGSECVVCLSEFEERDEGRVLPQCGHCFHVACIDRWLRSHSNCPICRAPIYVADQGVSFIEKGVIYGLQ